MVALAARDVVVREDGLVGAADGAQGAMPLMSCSVGGRFDANG